VDTDALVPPAVPHVVGGMPDVVRHQVPPRLIDRLPELYPDEHQFLARYTDLSKPVFYGPRFRNLTRTGGAGPTPVNTGPGQSR
jgi:hypothetical protein